MASIYAWDVDGPSRKPFGGSADLTMPNLAGYSSSTQVWTPWPNVSRSFLYLRGFQTRGGVALASPFGTTDDNTVLRHQLILYMGRISPCRACRSMGLPSRTAEASSVSRRPLMVVCMCLPNASPESVKVMIQLGSISSGQGTSFAASW